MSLGDITIAISDAYYVPPGEGATYVADPGSTLDVPFMSRVHLNINAQGDFAQDALTGTFTDGSFTVTAVPGPPASAGVTLGCWLNGINPFSSAQYLPHGTPNIVTAVGASSITFTNYPGLFDGADTPIPALQNGSNIAFTVTDPYPQGLLKVTSSPSSGCNVSDSNFDGTTDPNHTGSGLAICNYMGQAAGGVDLTFTQTGTFEITVEFLTNDTNYANTTSSDIISIVVASS